MRAYQYIALLMLICILPVMPHPLYGSYASIDLCDATSQITGSESHTHNEPDKDEPVSTDRLTNPVVWHDPGNIAAEDLYYGHGGKASAPRGPFVFESEERG